MICRPLVFALLLVGCVADRGTFVPAKGSLDWTSMTARADAADGARIRERTAKGECLLLGEVRTKGEDVDADFSITAANHGGNYYVVTVREGVVLGTKTVTETSGGGVATQLGGVVVASANQTTVSKTTPLEGERGVALVYRCGDLWYR